MKITKDYLRQVIRESLQEVKYDYAGLSAAEAAFIGRLARTAYKLRTSGGNEAKERELFKTILFARAKIGPLKINDFLISRISPEANNTQQDKDMYNALRAATSEALSIKVRSPKFFTDEDYTSLHDEYSQYL